MAVFDVVECHFVDFHDSSLTSYLNVISTIEIDQNAPTNDNDYICDVLMFCFGVFEQKTWSKV